MTIHMSEAVWGFGGEGWRQMLYWVAQVPVCFMLCRPESVRCEFYILVQLRWCQGLPKGGPRICAQRRQGPCLSKASTTVSSAVPRSRVASQTLDLRRPGSCRKWFREEQDPRGDWKLHYIASSLPLIPQAEVLRSELLAVWISAVLLNISDSTKTVSASLNAIMFIK